MGAWGLGFFESDHDFDRISEMSHDAGLPALEGKARERFQKERPAAAAQAEKAGHGDLPLLSIYADHCSDVTMVRDHLDSGALLTLIEQKRAAMNDKTDKFTASYALYDFVLLAACAMTLGCNLPTDYRAELAAKYRKSGLMRDSVVQMQLALSDGHKRYKDGELYDFSSKTIEQAADSTDAKPDNGRGFVMLNVPAPFGFWPRGGTAAEARLPDYPNGVCGGCGSEERGDGLPLLACGGCKVRKYCGRVCQAAHYAQHKVVCKA